MLPGVTNGAGHQIGGREPEKWQSHSGQVAAPIRVGIVGLSRSGGWAARAHVPALTALEEFALTALSCRSAESAAAAAAAYGVQHAFEDPQALAGCDEVDLVVVAVRTPEHRRAVRAALAAGKMVYCEWPLGVDLREAQEIAKLAGDRGVRTVIGLQARFAPALRYLKDLLLQGYVGRVLSVSVIGSGMQWGAATSAGQEYLLDRTNGATLTSIPIAHTLDTLEWLLGPVDSLQALNAVVRGPATDVDTGRRHTKTAPDQCILRARFTSGTVASLHYRGGVSAQTNLLWEINGTDGDLLVQGDSGHVQTGLVGIRGARHGERSRVLTVPSSYNDIPSLGADHAGTAVAHLYRALSSDLVRGRSTIPDFDHATGLHRIVRAIEHADATGRRLVVHPSLAGPPRRDMRHR